MRSFAPWPPGFDYANFFVASPGIPYYKKYSDEDHFDSFVHSIFRHASLYGEKTVGLQLIRNKKLLVDDNNKTLLSIGRFGGTKYAVIAAYEEWCLREYDWPTGGTNELIQLIEENVCESCESTAKKNIAGPYWAHSPSVDSLQLRGRSSFGIFQKDMFEVAKENGAQSVGRQFLRNSQPLTDDEDRYVLSIGEFNYQQYAVVAQSAWQHCIVKYD